MLHIISTYKVIEKLYFFFLVYYVIGVVWIFLKWIYVMVGEFPGGKLSCN